MASIGQKLQLLRGLMDGQRAYTGPFYVTVRLTRRCNMRCLGCPYHSSQSRGLPPAVREAQDLPLQLALRLSEELPGLGTREVIITAEGEPMLHPQWADIVSCFHQAGCKVTLITNGTLIDEAAATKLVDSGLDVLSVSLWAATEPVYAQCYPDTNPSYLQKTVAGLRHVATCKAQLQSSRPAVNLRCVVNRFNWQQLDELIDLAHEVQCSGVALGPYMDWSGEFEHAALSRKQEASLRQSLAAIRRRLRDLGLSHNLDSEFLPRLNIGGEVLRTVPCYTPWYHAAIRSDGTVAPCGACYLELGDLTQQTFAEIWNGPTFRAFRRSGPGAHRSASADTVCDCTWCCHAHDGQRIHQVWRWLALLFGDSRDKGTAA